MENKLLRVSFQPFREDGGCFVAKDNERVYLDLTREEISKYYKKIVMGIGCIYILWHITDKPTVEPKSAYDITAFKNPILLPYREIYSYDLYYYTDHDISPKKITNDKLKSWEKDHTSLFKIRNIQTEKQNVSSKKYRWEVLPTTINDIGNITDLAHGGSCYAVTNREWAIQTSEDFKFWNNHIGRTRSMNSLALADNGWAVSVNHNEIYVETTLDGSCNVETRHTKFSKVILSKKYEFVFVGDNGASAILGRNALIQTVNYNYNMRLADCVHHSMKKIEGIRGDIYIVFENTDDNDLFCITKNKRVYRLEYQDNDENGVWMYEGKNHEIHEDVEINDVVYGNGEYVFITDQSIFKTTDFVRYKFVNTIPNKKKAIEYTKITYGNGMFVVIEKTGNSYYSYDAENWFPLEGLVGVREGANRPLSAFNILKFINGNFICIDKEGFKKLVEVKDTGYIRYECDHDRFNPIKRKSEEHRKESSDEPINKKEIKENNIMNNTMNNGVTNPFNFNFGPYNNPNVAMSYKGIAVRNDGTDTWNVYSNGTITDVTAFLMQGFDNIIYAMPARRKELKINDIIIHDNKVMVVKQLTNNKDKSLSVIDIATGDIKNILPIENMFGFNFFTKLTSMLDMEDMFDVFGDEEPEVDPDGNPIATKKKSNMMETMMMMSMFSGGNTGMNPFQSTGENGQQNPMMQMMQFKMMNKFFKSDD